MGYAPDSFWTTTPRLYALAAEGHARRAQRDHANRAWLAWHIAALDRAKRLPRLKAFMGDKPVRPQPSRRSSDHLLDIARMWNAELKAASLAIPGDAS